MPLLTWRFSNSVHPIFAIRDSPLWDLHDLPLAVACILLTDSLLQVLREKTFNEPSFREIVVVTGKGLGSGPDGPVLRTGVPQFLRDTFGPEILLVERNEGRFHLSQKALRTWVDSGNSDKFRGRFSGDERG